MSLLQLSCGLPQSTGEEAGSGIHECRQKAVRPALHALPEHPDCFASALQSQFLHSLVELQGKTESHVSNRENYPQTRATGLNSNHEMQPAFRPLWQTHAQPAHAALAADAGGSGAEGVEGDGSDDQRQVQGQVYRTGYVYVYLRTDARTKQWVRTWRQAGYDTTPNQTKTSIHTDIQHTYI